MCVAGAARGPVSWELSRAFLRGGGLGRLWLERRARYAGMWRDWTWALLQEGQGPGQQRHTKGPELDSPHFPPLCRLALWHVLGVHKVFESGPQLPFCC